MTMVVDESKVIGLRMQSEQATLEELIKEATQMNVSDEDVDGVDRLIYNHCLNKGALQKFFGVSKVTFNKRIADAVSKEIIGEPIFQNRQHLFTRFDIKALMDYWGVTTYSHLYKATVITMQNHKGGTGKTSTVITLATSAALDLNLNARVLVIDFDPQGSAGYNMIHSSSTKYSESYLTLVDVLLAKYEKTGEFSNHISNGNTFEQVLDAVPFSTHLPNMDVIPAFPTDDRFTDIYWQLDELERKDLLKCLAEKVMPLLREKYDLIFIDTPPQDSPLLWTVNEATDCILIPITPREFDFISTTNYMLTLSKRMRATSPSQGENVKWMKVLAVNVNEKSNHESDTIDKLIRTVRDRFFSSYIHHSEAFVAASGQGRTVLDVRKSEGLCSGRQFDLAESSVKSVYHQFMNEIKKVSIREL